jgi:hypothetical protein
MKNTTNTFSLPIGLTFSGMNRIPGRGDAGWTVVEFESIEAARAWMKSNPSACLPCWARISAE